MSEDWKSVSEKEFLGFIKNYPNKLNRDVLTIVEPPILQFCDFELGDWPECVVAEKSEAYTGGPMRYQIRRSVMDSLVVCDRCKKIFNKKEKDLEYAIKEVENLKKINEALVERIHELGDFNKPENP